MRGVFGILSLVVVLAVVGLGIKSQLHASASAGSRAEAAAASAAGLTGADGRGSGPESGVSTDRVLTEGERIKAIQQQAASGVEQAMQRGAERNDRADQ